MKISEILIYIRVGACMLSHCSHAQILATQWTIALQGPLSMGFSSKNTVMGCHALLQGIFLTQGLNPHLLYCRWILYY